MNAQNGKQCDGTRAYNTTRLLTRIIGLTLLIISGSALPATADRGEGPLADQYVFTVGSFFSLQNTKVRLDSELGNVGTTITLEKDLDAKKDAALFRVSGTWRFADRHQVRLGYYQVKRDSEHRIDERIEWGDTVFDIGANVKTEMNSYFPGLDYTYWLHANEKTAFGINTGLILLGLEVGLRVDGDEDAALDTGIDSTSIVPLLGAEFRALPKPWLLLRAGAGYITNFSSAQAASAEAAAEARVHRNVWLGGSYGIVYFNVEQEDYILTGELDWRVHGAQAYLRIGF